MAGIQDRYGEFKDAGATVIGVSADSAFAQNAFRDAYDLEFDIPGIGLYDVSNRAVFVLDEEGTVTYTWIADEPGNEPDYDELLQAVEEAR